MSTVTYRLTVADLVDGRTYAYNNMPLVKVMRLVPFALAIGSLLLGAYRASQGNWSGAAALGGWFFWSLVLTAWMFVGNRLLLPGSVRQQIAHSKALQDDIAVSWDAERIVFETSHGESRWPWGDLYRWQESSGGLLLWSGNQMYHYLPKRTLADAQVSEIRASLTEALGSPGKRRN